MRLTAEKREGEMRRGAYVQEAGSEAQERGERSITHRENRLRNTCVFHSSDGGGHLFIFGAREICGTQLPEGEGHRDQCMSVATIAMPKDGCRTRSEICARSFPRVKDTGTSA
jgi:hypothetical protein